MGEKAEVRVEIEQVPSGTTTRLQAKRRPPRALARRAKRTPQTIVESKPVGVGDR